MKKIVIVGAGASGVFLSLILKDKNNEVIVLEKNEEITQIKITFDKVQSNFTSVTGPEIYVKLKKNVKKDDIIENNTDLTGKYNDISLKDESKVKTVIKHKVIDKKLPRTGC